MMLTIRTLCAEYLQENFYLAARTRDGTERAVRYFAGHCGNFRLDRLKYQHFEKYKGFLLRTGRAKSTVNHYLRAIKRVLNWAVTCKYIDENPMSQVRQFKLTRKPVRVYETWQVERMIRCAPDQRQKAIILFAWNTGFRRGEILNLNMDNIRDGYAYVEPKRNTRSTWEWEPKDREIRRVGLRDEILCEVGKCGRYYPFLTERQYGNCLDRKKITGVLPEDLRRCPDRNFRRWFVRLQMRAFGRQIGDFHMLRKTYTTDMCEVLPGHAVMKLTGHSNLKTLTYYTAVRESHEEIARQSAGNGKKIGMPGLQTTLKGGVCIGHPTGR